MRTGTVPSDALPKDLVAIEATCRILRSWEANMEIPSNTSLRLLFGALLAAASGAHAGTILVSNNTSGTIGAYTTSGPP